VDGVAACHELPRLRRSNSPAASWPLPLKHHGLKEVRRSHSSAVRVRLPAAHQKSRQTKPAPASWSTLTTNAPRWQGWSCGAPEDLGRFGWKRQVGNCARQNLQRHGRNLHLLVTEAAFVTQKPLPRRKASTPWWMPLADQIRGELEQLPGLAFPCRYASRPRKRISGSLDGEKCSSATS